jgi:hypothetical protein
VIPEEFIMAQYGKRGKQNVVGASSAKRLARLAENLHRQQGTTRAVPTPAAVSAEPTAPTYDQKFLAALNKQLDTVARQKRWSRQETNAAHDYAEELVLLDGKIPASIQHLSAHQRAVQETFKAMCNKRNVAPGSLPGQLCSWYKV